MARGAGGIPPFPVAASGCMRGRLQKSPAFPRVRLQRQPVTIRGGVEAPSVCRGGGNYHEDAQGSAADVRAGRFWAARCVRVAPRLRFSSLSRACGDAQCCYSTCQQQNKVCYKLVYEDVQEKRWRTCYQTVCETVNRQVCKTCYREETHYKDCHVTKYKTVIEECMKPVTRHCVKEINCHEYRPQIECCVKEVECCVKPASQALRGLPLR